MVLAHDAIVLAGGTGRRMGGVLKPQVSVGGRRLLDHVLDATTGAGCVVVVAPETVPVPDGVVRTLEDPPHGGPVAGIAAGLREVVAPLVLVLACDLPGVAPAVPRLLAEAAVRITPARQPVGSVRNPAVGDGGGGRPGGGDGSGGHVDGVVLCDEEGREQWLLGVYSTAALRARVAEVAGHVRGMSVRELVRPMCLASLGARPGETNDVDTWADRDAISP